MSDKIMPVEQCGAVGKCQASPSGYASYMSSSRWGTPSPESVAQYAMQQLEVARQKDVETHERNLPALEANKAIAARVEAFMAEIGMPRSYTERDTKSRARYPKSVTVSSGWLSDVARHIKTSDGFEYSTTTYQRMKRDYDAYLIRATQEAEAKRAEQQRKIEAEKEARKANVELARIVLRYELPEDSEWRDVLDALCKKDQRINLAIAMMRVRADWNEGPYPVSNAISSFTIETDEDKDIANDILACLHDFEDGRVFRDTSWGYDRLLASIADQQLATDAQLAYDRSGGSE